jgi:hypothetical protein
MEIALLVALVLTNGGWLVYVYKRDQRESAERQTLLDRIEAPGQVVVQREVAEGPDLPSVPFDDDEAFFEAKQEALT